MTEKNYFYATHNGSPLPSRQEQHRYTSEILSAKDFCTDYPGYPGHTINKIAASLKWTLDNEKRRNKNLIPK